jgi:casein kinase 1
VFDETPDYDFLRDLFSTALVNAGGVEDGVYDWMTLNNGKGWEANSVAAPPDPSRQHRSRGERERERDRAERLRTNQGSANGTNPASPV